MAWLWPLWGDAHTEYADYSHYIAGLIRQNVGKPATTLLDIGCGGGKNVLNLKKDFEVTGLDISPAMLAQAAAINSNANLFMTTCDLLTSTSILTPS